MPLLIISGDGEVTLTIGIIITLCSALVTMVWKASRTTAALESLQKAFRQHRRAASARHNYSSARIERLERIVQQCAARSNLHIEEPIPHPSASLEDDDVVG